MLRTTLLVPNTFELYEYQLFTKEPIEQALDPDTSLVVNGENTVVDIYIRCHIIFYIPPSSITQLLGADVKIALPALEADVYFAVPNDIEIPGLAVLVLQPL